MQNAETAKDSVLMLVAILAAPLATLITMSTPTLHWIDSPVFFLVAIVIGTVAGIVIRRTRK